MFNSSLTEGAETNSSASSASDGAVEERVDLCSILFVGASLGRFSVACSSMSKHVFVADLPGCLDGSSQADRRLVRFV